MALSASSYTTTEGDVIDKICLAKYGVWNREVMMLVYNANPWMARSHLRLEAGKTVVFPDATVAVTKPVKTFPLWVNSPQYQR